MREEDIMRRNLRRGIAWLLVGAAVTVALELVWDAVVAARAAEPDAGAANAEDAAGEGAGFSDLAARALDGGAPAMGEPCVPPGFAEECFDPSGMGEVSCSPDGAVVGIDSGMAAEDLFRACTSALEGNGWTPVESGMPLRSSFLKDGGGFQWLFLDVTQVGDGGVAVVVVEGEA